jgi:hypothetical protein
LIPLNSTVTGAASMYSDLLDVVILWALNGMRTISRQRGSSDLSLCSSVSPFDAVVRMVSSRRVPSALRRDTSPKSSSYG